MTESQDTEREKLENIWIRLVYMVLFFIGHRIASFILGLIAAIQFILVLIGQSKNARLLGFAVSINKYIYRTGRYLSFESEDKPFPFTDFPDSDKPLAEPSEAAPAPAAAPKKKTATRRSTSATTAKKKTTASRKKASPATDKEPEAKDQQTESDDQKGTP